MSVRRSTHLPNRSESSNSFRSSTFNDLWQSLQKIWLRSLAVARRLFSIRCG